MSGERESFGHTTFHAGRDAWVRCATYPATGHLPSLSVDGCGLGVTVYLAGEVINADHVRFARDLAAQAERFAAEAERLHAEAQAASGSKDAAASDVA